MYLFSFAPPTTTPHLSLPLPPCPSFPSFPFPLPPSPLPAPLPGVQCLPQRAALLKSMLTFLKKAIPDPAFSDSIRHVMDGNLPRSLKVGDRLICPLLLLFLGVVELRVFFTEIVLCPTLSPTLSPCVYSTLFLMRNTTVHRYFCWQPMWSTATSSKNRRCCPLCKIAVSRTSSYMLF